MALGWCRHALSANLQGGVPSHVLREGLQSWYVATPGWSFVQLGHLRKQVAQHLQLLAMQNALLASSTEHLHHEALAAVRLMLQHILVRSHYNASTISGWDMFLGCVSSMQRFLIMTFKDGILFLRVCMCLLQVFCQYGIRMKETQVCPALSAACLKSPTVLHFILDE